MQANQSNTPIPMRLPCPKCHELHVDEGEFATKPHHTHSCQHCGLTWRPAIVATVGVRFLLGFKDEGMVDWRSVLPASLRVQCAECGDDTNSPGTFGYAFQNGKWYCERHSAEVSQLLKENERLKNEIVMHREKANGEYWAWQGDGEDHLESLVCPVLIHAGDLLKMQQGTTDHPKYWDCHAHRTELRTSDSNTVFHEERGQLCWWEDHWDCRIYYPIKFKDKATAVKWIKQGTIAELQEGSSCLQIGFSKISFQMRQN